MMPLQELRDAIDSIDRTIVDHLHQRMELAKQVGMQKKASCSEIYSPGREEQVLQKWLAHNAGKLPDKTIHAIYREVVSSSIATQKSLQVAYLGPRGTYTEQAMAKVQEEQPWLNEPTESYQAAWQNFGSSINYLPLKTISDVFFAVEQGEANYGVIPIENSTEGAVIYAFDLLADTELKIIAQTYLPIEHCLLSHGQLSDIKEVHSHDNALGQCRQWLNRVLPEAAVVKTESTAQAVQQIKTNPKAAAIASHLASRLYEVPTLAKNIQDKDDNITRFLVIGKTAGALSGEGDYKSSFLFSLNDEPGALQKALHPFSQHKVNLTKIVSRPNRKKLWDYYFFIDVEGHYQHPPVSEAIAEIKKLCPLVKWLGSYPSSTPNGLSD